MKELSFSADRCLFHLSWAQDPSGDLEVDADVTSQGFSGSCGCFVLEKAWASFTQGLAELESRRQGEARLQSIPPGELDVKVFSVDSRGHMAVAGELGDGSARAVAHRVRFHFEFDPAQLERAVRAARSGGPSPPSTAG